MGDVSVMNPSIEQFSSYKESPAVSEKGVKHCSASCKKNAVDHPPAHFRDDCPKSPDSFESTPALPVTSVGNISIAKETVCAMGIPELVVQMAIDIQRLEGGSDFENASQLYMAADDLCQHPERQSRIVMKLFEAEEARKEKENAVIKLEMQNRPVVDSKPSKTELQEKVKKLAKENYKLKQRKMCRACRKVDLASSGVTFLPCGHFITCETCSENFDDCPACGKMIMGTVRTFLS